MATLRPQTFRKGDLPLISKFISERKLESSPNKLMNPDVFIQHLVSHYVDDIIIPELKKSKIDTNIVRNSMVFVHRGKLSDGSKT